MAQLSIHKCAILFAKRAFIAIYERVEYSRVNGMTNCIVNRIVMDKRMRARE